MFDIEFNVNSISNTILSHFEEGKTKVEKVLSSPGYEGIIQSFEVSDYLTNIEIEFEEGIVTENQNVFQTLAYGGQFLKREEGKEDEYLSVPPSQTLQKYIGFRK